MKTIIFISVLSLLTSCGLECIEKETGLPRVSSTIKESKEKSVFQFEMQPNKLKFLLDSGRVFEIENAWVECSWTYECVNNEAVLTKGNYMQVVIKPKTMPKRMPQLSYAIMEKGKGAFFGSSHLDFSYKGQDTVFLQLVKFKRILDSSKTYFDKIWLTKKVSR